MHVVPSYIILYTVPVECSTLCIVVTLGYILYIIPTPVYRDNVCRIDDAGTT